MKLPVNLFCYLFHYGRILPCYRHTTVVKRWEFCTQPLLLLYCMWICSCWFGMFLIWPIEVCILSVVCAVSLVIITARGGLLCFCCLLLSLRLQQKMGVHLLHAVLNHMSSHFLIPLSDSSIICAVPTQLPRLLVSWVGKHPHISCTSSQHLWCLNYLLLPTAGDFTFWLSPWLSLLAETKN